MHLFATPSAIPHRRAMRPLLLAALTVLGSALPAPAQGPAQSPTGSFVEAVERSGFIFIGTVRPAGEVEAPAGGERGDLVVVVDRILEALPPVGDPTGLEVVVQPRRRGYPSPGQTAVFFTYVRSAGETFGLVEVASTPPEDPELLERRIREARAILADRALAARLARSERVVVGTVAETRPTEGALRPTSEHDPRWWWTRIEVESTLKGPGEPAGTAVVYFASSEDVVWRQAPKLETGDRGIYLLQPDSGRPGLEGTYTVEGPFLADPLDALPLEELARVRRLLAQPR